MATSLKLPDALRERIAAVAEHAGVTPHAFMLEAIEERTRRAELRQAFVAEALEAEEAFQETGLGFAPGEVHDYLRAIAKGKKAKSPRPRRWRK